MDMTAILASSPEDRRSAAPDAVGARRAVSRLVARRCGAFGRDAIERETATHTGLGGLSTVGET